MSEKTISQPETLSEGALRQSLRRNNKEIRQDRADTIEEELEMAFSRAVKDLEMKLKRLTREREAIYDFSPTNAQSLVMAKELHGDEILIKDSQLSIQIRQVEIELEIAKGRYTHLFGQIL